MAWRERPSLTPEEARQLHYEALVIDTQQPAVTRGLLFTPRMREALQEMARQGLSREEAYPILAGMAAQEVQRDPQVRQQYLEMWRRAGVTVACATYAGTEPPERAFEAAVRSLSYAHAFLGALEGDLLLVRKADDILRAHRDGKHGLVLDFQNTTPIGNDLTRLEVFYNLGVRMIQLTYNLRNLVGDGCTETHKSGLTYFGREMVRAMNDLRILVDVSHCSEQVGFDAVEVSRAPVVVSHSSAYAICPHDRAKSDALAKAVAEKGGVFGVVIIPGFITDRKTATLEDFCRHVEHLVRLVGIDAVAIGTDKTGPGPGTESLIEWPPEMPKRRPGAFDWSGFRPEEHRLTYEYQLDGYRDFRDWPEVTVALARWGFNEDELRRLLGLNFLRVFREVVG